MPGRSSYESCAFISQDGSDCACGDVHACVVCIELMVVGSLDVTGDGHVDVAIGNVIVDKGGCVERRMNYFLSNLTV